MLFLRRAHSPDHPPLDSNPLPTDCETGVPTNAPPGTSTQHQQDINQSIRFTLSIKKNVRDYTKRANCSRKTRYHIFSREFVCLKMPLTRVFPIGIHCSADSTEEMHIKRLVQEHNILMTPRTEPAHQFKTWHSELQLDAHLTQTSNTYTTKPTYYH